MALTQNSIIESNDILKNTEPFGLKIRIKNEMARRRYASTSVNGGISLEQYAIDFTEPATSGSFIKQSHYDETVGYVNHIYEHTDLNNPKILALKSLSDDVDLYATRAVDSSETDCNNTCTGLCYGNCTGACKGSCSSYCADGCDSSCYTGCYTGCQDDCKGGCKGTCEVKCNSNCYDGCEGGCKGSCKGACSNACGACPSTCAQECYKTAI